MTDHPTRHLNQAGVPSTTEPPTQRLPAEGETKLRPCLRCGFPMIDAEVAAQNGSLGSPRWPLTVRRVTEAMGFWGPKHAGSSCRALVCTRCGYTELETMDPQRLLGGGT